MSSAPYRAGKRLVDIVVSSLALVIAAPIFALVALAVKLHDSGSVFFTQARAGKGGHEFRVIKFRTMSGGAAPGEAIDTSAWTRGVPDDFVFKTPDSGLRKVTPVGRWLRRSSLDELPQFLNVLKGEMSLVGPRPEILPIVERYSTEQARRLSVKPGITGWAQVTGRAFHTHGEKIAADVFYVENASARLDLLILLRTLWVAVRGKDAF